jgi:hypothetical protein
LVQQTARVAMRLACAARVSAGLGNAKTEIGGAAVPGLKSKPVLDLGEFGPARVGAGWLARMFS